jgi:hypothetical protein
MKQEYRYAKGWRIFSFILFPSLMIGFGYLGIMPYIKNADLVATILLTALSIGVECLMVLGLIDLYKGKLVLEENTISAIGIFKTRSLKLSEIKGFKRDNNYLYYIPLSNKLKQIKVSSYMGRYSYLVNWTEQRFTNLDLQELQKEEEEILTNEDFGSTVEEREELLKKAKKVSRIINTISFISAISLWFTPKFYNVQVLICAALPIIGFIIYKRFKGLIRIDDTSNSNNPNILLSTFFMPSCVLMIRAFADFNVLNYENLWKPVIVIFASLAFVMIKDSNVKYNFKKGVTYIAIIGIFVLGSMYAYGFIITSNSIFDPSRPEFYKAKVLDKRVSSGKSTTYYLELSRWGPQNEIEEVQVKRTIYIEKEVGDSALISFKKGLYKIPYYTLIE